MRNSSKAFVYLGLWVQDSGPRIRVQGSGDLGRGLGFRVRVSDLGSIWSKRGVLGVEGSGRYRCREDPEELWGYGFRV